MKRTTMGWTVLGALAVTCAALLVFSSVWEPSAPIEGLIDPKTRLRTYHRLWVETESARKYDFHKPLHRFSTFQRKHPSILIQEISVPDDPDHPLYLTLREYANVTTFGLKPPWDSWDRGLKWSSWKGWLFPAPHHVDAPPLSVPSPDPLKTRYVISLHAHDGTLLDEEAPRPFRGNNVAETGEVIHDINRDGWVERVGTMNVGLKDPNAAAELLTITRINRETEEIFHALINVGRDESAERWGFACRDVDGDGTLEVEIGPKNGTGISPEVTFFWNAASREFESPSGKAGPHFLVLPSGDHRLVWEALEKLSDEGRLSYPLDR